MLDITFNTKQKGVLTYLGYREDDGTYVAVCLNLNLVEYGDDPKELKKSIQEAAMSYIKAVRKKNLSDDYLNLVPNKKYLKIFADIALAKELFEKSHKTASAIKAAPSYLDFKKRPYEGQNFFAQS